jgi:uncharacterized RDD family membrane protein YckC
MKDFDNNEDFNLDDFDFKPITKGLGFHSDKFEDANNDLKIKRLSTPVKKKNHALSKFIESEEQSVDMGDLSAFYQNDKTQFETVTDISKSLEDEFSNHEEELLISAPAFERVYAWMIDSLVVFLTYTIALMIPFLLLDILGLKITFTRELFIATSPLLISLYVFYFSFLDKTQYSTLGKSTFSLVVVANDKKLSLYKSFGRTVISLLSIPSLGLTSLLGLQDKLSNTHVIRKS